MLFQNRVKPNSSDQWGRQLVASFISSSINTIHLCPLSSSSIHLPVSDLRELLLLPVFPQFSLPGLKEKGRFTLCGLHSLHPSNFQKSYTYQAADVWGSGKTPSLYFFNFSQLYVGVSFIYLPRLGGHSSTYVFISIPWPSDWLLWDLGCVIQVWSISFWAVQLKPTSMF